MMKRIIPYMCAVTMLLRVFTACQEDAVLINPDVTHGKSTEGIETVDSRGYLNSEACPESKIVQLKIGDPDLEGRVETDLGKKDALCFVLPKPAERDITLKIAMEETYAKNEKMEDGGTYPSLITSEFRKAYNMKVVGSEYAIPESGGLGYNLLINGSREINVTIQAGERRSEKVELLFKREYLRHDFVYLFPIQATDVETGELFGEIYYLIHPVEEKMKVIGEKPGVVIAYVDTEVMNPLIAEQFTISVDINDFSSGFEQRTLYKGPLLDILNVRTAFLKEIEGRARLTYTTDMEYVLKNRARYLRPMQKNGLKVCLAIMGGGTGLGFANLTDMQINDFVAQVQTAVDLYELDGVNLWDEGAGYGKGGMSPTNSTSYAKLIKALKTAMPGKLLTMVDTRETTEALCDEQAGIRVGDYLDYAWSSLGDILAPYEPDAAIRPLAGVPEKKYGTIFLQDLETLSMDEQNKLFENATLAPFMNMERFTPLSGTDVVVGADIPYMDYGKEGVWAEPWLIWIMCKYPGSEDGSISTSAQTETPYSVRDYYMFRKDW
ncbi:Glycosyl hydrolases family 18 [Bacteroides finegoldii]|uniref:Uncharacterized protein n=1 Tax=Bacteroides finegoldii CL09T03C10 TaxID=997888 RepID=K5CIC0_9BACE|nr:glycosyl hydrolase family 18 protein [Bacteroides finegoldii]EKJ89065.1 hypothetical protein HMPREF1057_03818 [Bacteroides finegoldii CL09T03C10]